MTQRGTSRALLSSLTLALAVACQQGDDRLTSSTSITPSSRASVPKISKPQSVDSLAPLATGSSRESDTSRPRTSAVSPESWIDQVANLRAAGADGDELLRLATLHPNPEIREDALEKLTDADDAVLFESLIAALGDEEPEIVLIAIAELESLDDRAAIPALVPVADHHADENVREAALNLVEFLD